MEQHHQQHTTLRAQQTHVTHTHIIYTITQKHQLPTTNNQQLTTNNNIQPTTNNQQPIINNQQPTTNNQQRPTTNNHQQPTTNNDLQPTDNTQHTTHTTLNTQHTTHTTLNTLHTQHSTHNTQDKQHQTHIITTTDNKQDADLHGGSGPAKNGPLRHLRPPPGRPTPLFYTTYKVLHMYYTVHIIR